MKLSLALLLTATSLTANERSRNEYLELIKNHPELVHPVGNASQGEIEIVLDPDQMTSIEKETGRDVGVLKSRPGVGVLPVMPDGTLVLNCEFRHATRSWELEMPRGGVKKGESLEEAARRELLEETGCVAGQLIQLGEAAGDSGVTGMILPVFMAKIKEITLPERESTEAIGQTLTLNPQEVREAFARGYLECIIGGKTTTVYVRDPFLAYALTLFAEGQKVKKLYNPSSDSPRGERRILGWV